MMSTPTTRPFGKVRSTATYAPSKLKPLRLSCKVYVPETMILEHIPNALSCAMIASMYLIPDPRLSGPHRRPCISR